MVQESREKGRPLEGKDGEAATRLFANAANALPSLVGVIPKRQAPKLAFFNLKTPQMVSIYFYRFDFKIWKREVLIDFWNSWSVFKY